MEFLSAGFFSALAAIIVIDLVLAGDNAIVIALAARNLPERLRGKAILWGTIGAIVVRSALTLAVVWLLKVPGLLLAGGALLVWIACRLLGDGAGKEAHPGAADGFWTAMRTIVVADALMGMDNVLAVAGAAHGEFLLVVLGLLISIPIVVWGSRLVLRLLERYPGVVYVGAAVLAWTAAQMMTSEPLLRPWLARHPMAVILVHVAVTGVVLGGGYLANQRKARTTVTER